MLRAPWFFVSDLHGMVSRYQKLFRAIRSEKPAAVFLGGDLLPSEWLAASARQPAFDDFFNHTFHAGFRALQEELGEAYPHIFIILGNDDPRSEEARLASASGEIWKYMHSRRAEVGAFSIYGYAYVPPTPFLLKDWERYDVTRSVKPGSISPEEGWRSAPVPPDEGRNATIQEDLEELARGEDLSKAIFLFHSPPYQTYLDQADLQGRQIGQASMDAHVGSLAIRRFIERRQPLITLHGHIHESARLSGSWMDRLGNTFAFSAAYDGPELALVRFDPENPATASREIL